MTPQFLTLLFIGLCLGQGDAGQGPLPRPILTAWPSSVVPEGGNVTLMCRTPVRELLRFVLRRGRHGAENVPSPQSTEGLAEFHLTALSLRDAGEYSCDYYRKEGPKVRSPESNVLVLLVVTGYFPKPSLQARPRGEVAAGENVTLQCRTPTSVTVPTNFTLLKAGEPTPTQVLASLKREASFSLLNMRASDSGSYSCVYYKTKSPFWASQPSNPISIQVIDKKESPTGTGGLGTIGFILIAMFTLFLILLAAFLICKYARSGAAPDKLTSSRSLKDPEQVQTNASTSVQSCSPAPDEGPWESRAEETYGVTYAQLDTRALGERPSSQMNQSLETCVYSALKT